MTRLLPSASWLAFVLLTLVAPTTLTAQADDPHAAQPERPTVATHAGTVAPGWLEVEAGFESDSYDDHAHGDLGPIEVKVGLAPHLQLAVQEAVVRAPGGQGPGFGDVAIGMKWRLLEHAPVLGDFAVLPSIKLPSGSVADDDGTGTTDVSLLLISSHVVRGIEIDLNAGVTHRSGDGQVAPTSASVWAAAAAGPVRGRLGWTSEIFGFPGTSGPAGAAPIVGVIEAVTFEWRPWLVFDVGVALPIAGQQPYSVIVGVVYNVARVFRAG